MSEPNQADAALHQAELHARVLDSERSEDRRGWSLLERMTADQGHALREVLFNGASAIVEAIREDRAHLAALAAEEAVLDALRRTKTHAEAAQAAAAAVRRTLGAPSD